VKVPEGRECTANHKCPKKKRKRGESFNPRKQHPLIIKLMGERGDLPLAIEGEGRTWASWQPSVRYPQAKKKIHHLDKTNP